MQYMLMLFEDEAQMNRATDSQGFEAYMAPWYAYTQEMREAGVIVDGNPLSQGHTATTISERDGKVSVQDGPFVDSKEQLGGYYVIDVPGLDDALAWAQKCPAARSGHVEIRPIANLG